MPPNEIEVELHPLDRAENLWCDVCLLPSATKRTFAVVEPDTLNIIGRVQATICLDCDTRFV